MYIRNVIVILPTYLIVDYILFYQNRRTEKNNIWLFCEELLNIRDGVIKVPDMNVYIILSQSKRLFFMYYI